MATLFRKAGQKVDVEGLRELDRALKTIDVNMRGKIMRSALMKAAKPMFLSATQNALAIRDSGALATAMGRWSRIGKQALPGQPDGRAVKNLRSVSVFIGPKMKDKKALTLWNAAHPQKEPAKFLRHAHLAEFGTGSFQGHRYMTRAFDANKIKFLFAFRFELKKRIDKIRV